MYKIIDSVPVIVLLIVLSACQTAVITQTPPEKPKPEVSKPSFKKVGYSDLQGWHQDNLTQAWPAFIASCKALANKPDWSRVCAASKNLEKRDNEAIREFFEINFTPYQIINADGTEKGLVTGYYEPLLIGSRQRGGVYQTPLYQPPSDLLNIDLASLYPELKGLKLRGRLAGNKVIPYPPRAELIHSGVMEGQEICWINDPTDAFFLQIQGSGRVFLEETKETIRVAYANQNGQPYQSIGRYLAEKGELKLEQASAQRIKNWLANHPTRQDEVFNTNPSYVFFKEEKISDPAEGPKGALGVPLSEKRSIAIDPRYVQLGAPIFISTTEPESMTPLNQLMMAQDTGGAIRGAVRADFFWGFGRQAGERAGQMKQQGMLWILWPNQANPLVMR